MNDLTLKRGCGLCFGGTNWKSTGDSKWENQLVFIPSGHELFLGNKTIRGIEFSVFKCLNDEFIAQPTTICKLSMPEDTSLILCKLEDLGIIPDVRPERKTNNIPVRMSGCMSFSGMNWKLAGDKKWHDMSGFTPKDLGESLGEREIGKNIYDIYRGPSGFIAVRRD
jgi:hypothetical protein